MILFFNLFFCFNKSLIVSNTFIESLSRKATFDSQRKTSKTSKSWIFKEIDLFISLNLWHIEILFLLFWRLSFFILLSWRLFLLKNLIWSSWLAWQDLPNHKLMRFRSTNIFDNFRRFWVKFSAWFKIILFQLLSLECQLTNVASW